MWSGTWGGNQRVAGWTSTFPTENYDWLPERGHFTLSITAIVPLSKAHHPQISSHGHASCGPSYLANGYQCHFRSKVSSLWEPHDCNPWEETWQVWRGLMWGNFQPNPITWDKHFGSIWNRLNVQCLDIPYVALTIILELFSSLEVCSRHLGRSRAE